MKKHYLIASFVLLAVGVWLVVPHGAGRLEVYFFDVGQGDSIFIKTPSGGTVLIDGGPDRRVLRYLGRTLPFGRRTIDLVILSHPHADHVTGLDAVLDRYRVARVIGTGAVHTTAEYLGWLQRIKDQHIPWQTALAGQIVSLGDGVRLEMLWPQDNLAGVQLDDLNTSSITVRLVYGQTAALFTGDITVDNEASILASGRPLAAQLLKVPHQGSQTSSSEAFIRAVNPRWAVIFAGQNNRYGHPHGEIVARYQQLGVEVLRTDQLGTIRFQSNGHEWQRREPWGLLNF